MTRQINASGARRRPLLAWGALALLSLGACKINDTLLDAKDPDLINPSDVQSPEGAIGLANGALGTFRSITAGSESTWLFGGLLADEWSTSSTFIQNDETDQRRIQLDNSSINGMLRRLYRTRTRTTEAIAALKQYSPNSRALIAELYFARGFAEMQLAQDFCNGIPMATDPLADPPENGTQRKVDEVFATALASYDTALTFANGTDAASVAINRATRIGRARALLGLNRIAEAGTQVSGIPTTFTYQHTFATTNTGTNTIWGQGLSARRYAIGDTVEGNTRNIRVANALPFASAKDPRLPVTDPSSVNGQDGQTRARTTTLYDQFTPVDVVNGIDARLIEAEAALKAGDVPGMLAILNALRAAPPKLGTVQPAAMAALTDPGTADGRINLLFREKAFWTFSRGQRLGDMRRLIRQYGRTEANTFPQGSHYKGGTYGTDVNLPIVTDEQNNPNFKACTDRNA